MRNTFWKNRQQLTIIYEFSECNILTGSPYFNYKRDSFDKNQLYSIDGNHIITPNTFFVLNSCGNHWVMLTNYDCDIDVWHFYDSLNGNHYLKSIELILGHFAPIYPELNFK